MFGNQLWVPGWGMGSSVSVLGHCILLVWNASARRWNGRLERRVGRRVAAGRGRERRLRVGFRGGRGVCHRGRACSLTVDANGGGRRELILIMLPLWVVPLLLVCVVALCLLLALGIVWVVLVVLFWVSVVGHLLVALLIVVPLIVRIRRNCSTCSNSRHLQRTASSRS
ncbi:hypothetical protein EDD21DRAFT_373938 [Dissophora ornata]|nr:hypothetical protein EDD21DRAFT_373938 [Dissophora ornata]